MSEMPLDFIAVMQGRRSDGRARGAKRNARALQTKGEQSEPKIWGSESPPWKKFLGPHPLDWFKMLPTIC